MGQVLFHLSYPAMCGADTRARTSDLPLTRRLLYQLSYEGVAWMLALAGLGSPVGGRLGVVIPVQHDLVAFAVGAHGGVR